MRAPEISWILYSDLLYMAYNSNWLIVLETVAWEDTFLILMIDKTYLVH